jgi:hypothetical protein
MLKNVRFAFIQKDTVKIMGSKRTFAKHGECGMELSDLLPNLGPWRTTSSWSARCTRTSSTTTRAS